MAKRKPLKLGFSPCPNDTFIFGALALKLIPLHHSYSLFIEDVETLNQRAFKKELDVTKLSFATFAMQTDTYQLLPVGAALGFGCGPLLVARKRELDLSLARIGIPGMMTTAAFLFRIFFPEAQNLICKRYDEIIPALKEGKIEAGLLIHEGRFVYKQEGLICLADLGRLWEKTYGLPIPLGGIFIKRTLPSPLKESVCSDIKESLYFAKNNSEKISDFIRSYAQELDQEVISCHLRTFVNEYTYHLGAKGREAVDLFLELAVKKGLIKVFQKDYFWEACP